jgi:hypothetical protein
MSDHLTPKNTIPDYEEAEFIHLLKQILGEVPYGRDQHADRLERRFNEIIQHPGGTDLIYWPEDGADSSAEGITEEIKKWREANGLPGFKVSDSPYQPPKWDLPGSMGIQEIKRLLVRPATKLIAGGFRPTHQNDESWLGKVFLFRPDEEVPQKASGEKLYPYAQFYLPNLPFISPMLKDVSVLTLFVSEPLPDALEPMGNNWVIREYGPDDVLVRKDLPVAGSTLEPFPLKPEFVAEDLPLWDGEDIPGYLAAEIIALEDAGEIEGHDDFGAHTYDHKIGGYPSFCQSGISPGEDFEFVFQISSDPKINLNVVDSGSLMFWKNRISGEWAIYYDFY